MSRNGSNIEVLNAEAIAAWNTRTDTIPDATALVRAALEAAAEVARSQISEPSLSDNPAYVRFEPSHLMAKKIAAHISALIDDPAALAEIMGRVKGNE